MICDDIYGVDLLMSQPITKRVHIQDVNIRLNAGQLFLTVPLLLHPRSFFFIYGAVIFNSLVALKSTSTLGLFVGVRNRILFYGTAPWETEKS